MSLLVLVALTSQLLLWPTSGDTALFVIAGRMLNDGATLYKDFWDVKQPGIFWFYSVTMRAGEELGPRVAEAALMIAVGLALTRFLMSQGWSHFTAVMAPLVCLTPVVLGSFRSGSAQCESLAASLFLLQAARLWRTDNPRNPSEGLRRWGAAGLAAGACLLLKFLFLPLSVLILVMGLLWRRDNSLDVKRPLLTWLAGLIAVLAGLLLWVASHDLWPVLNYTWLRLPVEMRGMEELHAGGGLRYVVRSLLQQVLLAAALAIVPLRRITRRIDGTPGPSTQWDRRWFRWGLWIGLLFVIALALVQLPSSYRFFPAATFLGLLAVPAIETLGILARRSTLRWRTVVLSAFLLLASPMFAGYPTWISTVRAVGHFGPRPAHNRPFEEAFTGKRFSETASGTVARQLDGDYVYVLGDPRLYFALGRDQAIAIHGWSPELNSPTIWEEAARELRCALPTRVFVDAESREHLRGRGAPFERVLSTSYRPSDARSEGTWWTAVDTPRGGNCSTEGASW